MSERIELQEPFRTLWRACDPFIAVERLTGTVYRELENRRTLETEVAGRRYFVKIHRGIGWGEIVKNLLLGKLPVLGAGQEWRALARLHAVGVPTMRAVAFGERGRNPARQHSFIVTEALTPTVDLEVYTRDWPHSPPPPALKRALIAEVARMLRTMHQAGVNHRDCYLCHFLLHTDTPVGASPRLSLIDLHRAQLRAVTPERWRDKDLASLFFSALEIGLTRRDLWRFLRIYFEAQKSLRALFAEEGARLSRLQRKAARLAERKRRYGDAL